MRKSHPFVPIFDSQSRILILGSLPSVVSCEKGFYYMHPSNRFWKILEEVFQEPVTTYPIPQKKEFLLRNHLALYDVVKSCEIDHSKDQTIRKAEVTDLCKILREAPIEKILFNGKKGYDLFCKAYSDVALPLVLLPSTSAANAQYSFDDLLRLWQKELK